jgi:hypothetical protein
LGEKELAILEHIAGALDEVVKILKKPENRFVRFLDIAAAAAGVLGLITILDILFGWFGG